MSLAVLVKAPVTQSIKPKNQYPNVPERTKRNEKEALDPGKGSDQQ